MRNLGLIGLINLLGCCLVVTFASAADLADSKEIYESKLQEIESGNWAKGEELIDTYRKSLDSLLASVQASGDLDKTTAVMQEKERFQRTGKVSEEPPTVSELASLWSAYRREQRKAQLDSARAIVVLRSQYDEALDGDYLMTHVMTSGEWKEEMEPLCFEDFEAKADSVVSLSEEDYFLEIL